MGSSTEFYRALAESVEAIEERRATVAECLARYPEHQAELQSLLPLVSALQHVPRVEPPAEFRQGARQRLLARLPATHGAVTKHRAPRYKEQSVRWFNLQRRFTMAWITAIAVIVSLLAGGGLAYAADGAAPGDVLYSLDRSIEQVRLQLTSDPQALFELQLALATERLQEADVLLSQAKHDRFAEALGNYDASVALIAATIQSSATADPAVLGGLLDEAIASHDTLLANMVYGTKEQAGDMVQIQDRDRLLWCSDLITDTHEITPTQPISNTLHPVGMMLADKWVTVFPELTYDDIMAWFCQGYGFGEINLALRISEDTGLTVDEILVAHADANWGQLLQTYGLIGPVKAQGSEDAPQGPVDAGGQGVGPNPQGPVQAGEGEGPQEPQEPQGPAGRVGEPADGQQQGPPAEGGSEDAGPPESAPRAPADDRGNSSGQGNGKP